PPESGPVAAARRACNASREHNRRCDMAARFLHGATFKVLGTAVLALLMLIPWAQVNGLVGEREGRAREATQRIAERWGAQQMLGGPVLVVPLRRQVRQDKEWTTVAHSE